MHDGFEEDHERVQGEIEQNLSDQVEAMKMGALPQHAGASSNHPIIQFPEEEHEQAGVAQLTDLQGVVQHGGGRKLKRTQKKPGQKSSLHGNLLGSPRSSDMIPALRGLSSVVVSMDNSDEVMEAVDQLPRKRTAIEAETKYLLFGKDLSAAPAGTKVRGGEQKRGRTKEESEANQKEVRRGSQDIQEATGHGAAGKLTGPSVAPRQSP
jgi:hypothetical protein